MKDKKYTQIRRSVFETNSSSTHSIVINYSDTFDNIPTSDSIVGTGDRFGWEDEIYNDFYSKLNYIISFLFYECETEENYYEIKKSDHYKLLEEVIKIETGIDLYVPNILQVKEKTKSRFDFYGHIDHQSFYVAEDALGSYKDLSCFLFNSLSVLRTGNDNDYDYDYY